MPFEVSNSFKSFFGIGTSFNAFIGAKLIRILIKISGNGNKNNSFKKKKLFENFSFILK